MYYVQVLSCCEQVLGLADKLNSFKGEKHKAKQKGYVLLSLAASLQGQSYGAASAGNRAAVKMALHSFMTSAQ